MSMENSQANSRIFSVRIVSIDWYMALPIPDFDICYSSFQGGKVNEVPVIRIYGSTPAGQKTCLHVHRAFPYLYVPCSDIPLHPNQEDDSYTDAVALALEKALKLKGSSGSKRQHVHGCSLVRARKFYGYHSSEELFVKIYLYYPQDVPRAASLLLGGAVLDKCLQPHEAHIPFILQFLIEYNLYGMGHAHLSKIKFRDPVPAAPRRFSYKWQNGLVVEKLTCTSAEIEAGLSTDESLDHPVWISSTIPGDWMWHFSSEFEVLSDHDTCPFKRQSICELEGDAAVDDILNQQFKLYTSLSQSSEEVKMVHSLVPIWEELYERIGLHEAAIPPDPGKPYAKDVLRTLLRGLECEKELAEFCGGSKENFLLDGDNVNEELLKSSGEKDIGSSSLPRSQCEEEVGTTSGERKDELLSANGVVFSGTFGHLEPKVSGTFGPLEPKDADVEALGLLKWLATSQAAEDINSDDELVRETILSPLLPITIDKVLEKANMDYESESQKECQDILESIEDVLEVEGLKEKTNNSISRFTHGGSSSKIAQGDALFSSNVRSSGHQSKVETKGEFKRSFKQQILQASEHKKKALLWGSLPFAVTQKENDGLEARGYHIAEEHVCEAKSCRPKLVAGDDGECSDALMENTSTGVCEMDDLFRSSVRDLMRRKRCRRVAPLDCGRDGAKSICSQEHKLEDIILPKQLDLHVLHDDERHKKPLKPVESRFLVDGQHKEDAEVHDSKSVHPCPQTFMVADYTSRCGKPLQAISQPSSAVTEEKCLKLKYKSKEQNSSIVTGYCETTNGKTLDCKGMTFPDAMTCSVTSDSLCGNLVSKDINVTYKGLLQKECTGLYSLPGSLNELRMFSRDDYQRKSISSGEQIYEIPSENPKGMDVSADTTVLQNEDCCALQFGDSGFFVHDTSISRTGFMEVEPENSISMSFTKKPPLASSVNWKDGMSEKASFSPALSCHPSIINNGLDELLPFFEEDCPEKKVVRNNSLPDSSSDVQQEAIIGVPTHYQNDGSLLYLLTPVYSPPSVGSLYKWLECNNKDTSKETNEQSIGPLLIEAPVGDQLQQGSSDIHPDCDQLQRLLHCEENKARPSTCSDCPTDLSQISGPTERLKSTPLSQIGFRDPASTGAGQQLAMLSIEVQAETRGDLKPDPRFDAIKVIALAFQNDNDSAIDVHVLLHDNIESDARGSDGVSISKTFYFSEEMHLFSHFIRVMGCFDPDILMGWDVQGGSLGFLAERAAHLGLGLLNKISRTPLEASIVARETEISDKGVFDAVLDESLVKELPLVDKAIIEDEWGRTHASGIHVGGRIVLNIWRLMRNEVKLNMYTIEAVCEAVLRRKIPLIPYRVLTKWFSSGPGRARYKSIKYMVQRAKLNLEIMNQIDMINRTSELARVFGIDFFSVLSRGSQYRVESMLLRLAHTQNYVAISPGNQQVASQPAMECLPLVMEPESGFYADPVVVLDFQSLYPSMIIAYNLCFCTCLGNVSRSKANILGVCSFSSDPHVLRDLKDEILLTPNGVMYVPPKVRKGILPRLLEEILSTRIMVKQAMKKLAPSQQVLHRIFNARQLALKLIANVTYGYTAAGFSGRMPCAELADSIVQCGRCTLENAISLVNANDKWNARVIYGDTDSMFVLLKGRTIEESFQIGREIASVVSAMNPDPVTLKFEKVYHPCFLLTKKRYVGYSYESADQIKPVFDAKGIETVRRDTCGAVAKMMEQSLRLFFEHQDVSEIKGYLQRQWARMLSGRVSLEDFIFAKEVRLGTYSKGAASSLPPAAIVATKAMRADPRAEPRYAERVPYVVIHGEPGARLVDMVVDPMDLLAIDSPYRLNDIYYINKQIIPALQRIFGLIGADLNQWFLDMPRPSRDAFAKRPSYVSNPQRTRIDYYYLSKHCVLCDELVHASTHICDKCSENETAAATALTGRTSKLEREMQHLAAICRHCGGGDWVVESGVKCTSLACSVFYERRKLQKELQSLSTVAAGKGLYPKCMVEWF